MILRLGVFCTILLALGPALVAQDELYAPAGLGPTGPYEIRGIVVDSVSDQPISEVELTIEQSAQPTGQPFDSTESGANGTFRFTNIAEGKYTIQASRQGYAPQAYLQHETFWTGVAVGPGKDSVHLRFPLSPSAVITGRVTDENGDAMREANVTLWKQQMENGRHSINQAGMTTTNDEGKYRFEHLAAGNYSVSTIAVPWYSRYGRNAVGKWNNQEGVRAYVSDRYEEGTSYLQGTSEMPDVVYATIYYPNSRDARALGWLIVKAGEIENADFQMQAEPSAHLQLTLSAEADGQRPNFALQKEMPGQLREPVQYASYESASPGVTEISGIPPGHYLLEVPSADGWDSPKIAQELDIDGNAQVDLETVPVLGPSIQGEITNAEVLESAPAVVLALKDSEGRTYRSLLRNEQAEAKPAASFAFEGVPAGPQTYELSIENPVKFVVKSMEAKGARATGTTMETDGKQPVSLTLTLAETGGLIDGIALRNGKPFPGAMILLLPENQKDWERLARRDQSDSDGTFHLPNILWGKYTLLALEHGWDLEWSKPEVLKEFMAGAMKLEITERQSKQVKIEVQ